MLAAPPVPHTLPARLEEAHQKVQPIPTGNQTSGTTGMTRPRSSTSSSNMSSRTISQSQMGMSRTASNGESSSHVTTPRKPSGGMSTQVSGSSSSGSHRLTSPPPPMPPPRDMPLPPLPPMPSVQSLPLVSTASSQSSLGRAAEKRTIVPPEVVEAKKSELRGLGLGPVVSGVGRDPRKRDASAPAAMNGASGRPHASASESASTSGREVPKVTARKMSSPPLGGLFSRLGGKSSTSLNSTGGSFEQIRMTDAPTEFGVLPRGASQQVDSVPLAGPSSETSSYTGDSSATSHSLPVGTGKRNLPAVGIGRPSTAYYGARQSEEVTRQLSSSDISKDASKAVQPRKSSGGLKALFSRNKNKDRPADRSSPSLIPEVPTHQPAPVTKRRASEDMLRSRKLDLKPTEPLRLPVSNRSTSSGPNPSNVSALPVRRPSPPTIEPSEGRLTTPQPTSSPPTPTAANDRRDRSPLEERTAQPSVQKLPPSISLHLGDLPQLDLSLGSTFDDLMKALDLGNRTSPQAGKKASPVKSKPYDRRRSRSFSDYSHSSSGQSLVAGEAKSKAIRRKSRVESSASLAADLAAYRSLDAVSPAAGVPPSIPTSSLSDHHRTLSGVSSASGHSPPTTPVTHEEGRVHIYTSQSSSSTNPLSGDSPANVPNVRDPHQLGNTDPAPAPDKSKPVRPSLLQVAESQRSTTTILEQDEVKPAQESPKGPNDLSALGLAPLAPPIEISVPQMVTLPPAIPKKEQLGSRQVRLPRKSRAVQSQYTAVELAGEMRRILVM